MGTRRRAGAVLALSVLCGAATAGSAWGAIHAHDETAKDLDVRTGEVAPTRVQRAAAQALDADVVWNQFGTPSSLVEGGGTLASGVPGKTAVAAAERWLADNRRLFRLRSTKGLELDNDARLARSDGHAVTFRQVFDGRETSAGGTVTIGLKPAGGGWDVVSASSTITGGTRLAGKARIGTEEGWRRAAASVGRVRSDGEVDRIRAGKGASAEWAAYDVEDLPDVQRARQVAFPTAGDGVVPAVEALVVDTRHAEPSAYRTIVDARTERVLLRESLVDHFQDQPAPPSQQTFGGTLPAEDGACDVRKGPYTVAEGSRVRAIDVFANADQPLQDIVLRLYRGDTLLTEADTLRTPERIRYAPAGGVPAGDYFVEVCEYADEGPPVEPRTYSGTIRLDTSAAPTPYLARWLAFPSSPPLGRLATDPWATPSTDIRERWCWRATPGRADCDRGVGNLASRTPWDVDPRTNLPTLTTAGNNAITAESWQSAILPGPTGFRPSSAQRDYSFPWTNEWNRRDCDPGTPYGSAFVPGRSMDVSAAVTNLFAAHNRMHDWSYFLGFTEENWNAQTSNFGLTETNRENDPLLGDAQAGATLTPPGVYLNARNNANMISLPDGISSITNMYFWQPVAGTFYPPCADGDYDMAIIGHEYGHMIENRMVGKGNRRTGHHAGAMGESVGDLMAIEYLNANGFAPVGGENPYAVGTYATGNKLRGIRNYAANFPMTGDFPRPGVYPQVAPLNFSDVGYDLTGPQVHADGEIWTATNFDVRRALSAKYAGRFPESDVVRQQRCASGAIPVEECPGTRRWIQLLFDAFLLMPTAPSMLDARNAMLAADTLRFDGVNQPELWLAFARRGFGSRAFSTNTTGRRAGEESDTDPLPDFESRRHGAAAVTFEAVSAEEYEGPVKARIHVGHYEGRVSPIADTDPGTSAPAGATSNNLDDVARFAPGTYEFVATAPGFGHVRFRRTFGQNTARTVQIRFTPNYASATLGARASGDATAITSNTPETPEVVPREQVLRRLIDDTEATNWQSAATQSSGGTWAVAGKQVTVDLSGDAPRTIRRVNVSAMLGPVFDPNAIRDPTDLTQSRFSALRRFEIWACNATQDDCATDGGFERVYTSAADAFPGDAPRPVAPTLNLRTFTFRSVDATHLRLVVRSSQCTGGPAYQGEQDADPNNATDCDSAAPAASRFVRAAELQAFDDPSTVVDVPAP